MLSSQRYKAKTKCTHNETANRRIIDGFGEVVARDPFFLVGKGDRPGFRLADLARLRLATVSEVPTPWLCVQHDLRRNGIDPHRLERVANRTMADNLAALGRGELDVARLFEPYASIAVRAGIGEILHHAYEDCVDQTLY